MSIPEDGSIDIDPGLAAKLAEAGKWCKQHVEGPASALARKLQTLLDQFTKDTGLMVRDVEIPVNVSGPPAEVYGAVTVHAAGLLVGPFGEQTTCDVRCSGQRRFEAEFTPNPFI